MFRSPVHFHLFKFIMVFDFGCAIQYENYRYKLRTRRNSNLSASSGETNKT